MPTLRQKVDTFCKESGSKVSDSDKLRNQLGMMKQKMKKMQDTHKHQLHLAKAAAKTQKAKSPKVPKVPKTRRAPKIKQEVAMNPLPAQAEPMMPAPAPTLAPAAPAQPKGGRSRRRRMR
jgi:hypothetical protein